MSNPEETIQEAIWLLRDITHEISLGNEVKDSEEIVKAVAPHLLRSLRVALRMVQNEPELATSSSYGCAWEISLATSLLPFIKSAEETFDAPVQDEEPEE